jgi:hypothetical protein
MIPIFEGGKTIHDLDHVATVIGVLDNSHEEEEHKIERSWDRGFESHSRHGCLYCVRSFCVYAVALRRIYPPSKVSYRLCIESRN